MTLQEALATYKKVNRKNNSGWYQYFPAKMGPHKDLVDCSYFVIDEEDGYDPFFSTSMDLYPEDIFSNDWGFYEKK